MNFSLQLKQFNLQEVCIELFVPESKAIQDSYQQGNIAFPYWAQVWPAAQALAGFLLGHTAYIEQKKVVELAAGLGLPSMVAARYARKVLCSDCVPEAVAIIQQSAAHNRLHNLSVRLLDWERLPEDLEAEVLLLSDVNYDPAAFSLQQELIQSFLQKGAVVLLSTPQRLMAKAFLTPLLFYCREQEEIAIVHEGKEVMISVLVLRK
jgi:predicted nicotinamide N-methyase